MRECDDRATLAIAGGEKAGENEERCSKEIEVGDVQLGLRAGYGRDRGVGEMGEGGVLLLSQCDRPGRERGGSAVTRGFVMAQQRFRCCTHNAYAEMHGSLTHSRAGGEKTHSTHSPTGCRLAGRSRCSLMHVSLALEAPHKLRFGSGRLVASDS